MKKYLSNCIITYSCRNVKGYYKKIYLDKLFFEKITKKGGCYVKN